MERGLPIGEIGFTVSTPGSSVVLGIGMLSSLANADVTLGAVSCDAGSPDTCSVGANTCDTGSPDPVQVRFSADAAICNAGGVAETSETTAPSDMFVLALILSISPLLP